MRCNKRQRRRGGQAGECEEEMPQEPTRQPVGVDERQTGGGVTSVMLGSRALRSSVVDERTGGSGSTRRCNATTSQCK
jgi:hypothetical protein